MTEFKDDHLILESACEFARDYELTYRGILDLRTGNLRFGSNLYDSALFTLFNRDFLSRLGRERLEYRTGPEAFASLTPCPFREERVFNFRGKNTSHKSGAVTKKGGTRQDTRSASKRASGILRSCEMCKSRQKTFSLIFRAAGYREETLPPPGATHNPPHIFAPPGIFISRHGAFLIGTVKGKKRKDRQEEGT